MKAGALLKKHSTKRVSTRCVAGLPSLAVRVRIPISAPNSVDPHLSRRMAGSFCPESCYSLDADRGHPTRQLVTVFRITLPTASRLERI